MLSFGLKLAFNQEAQLGKTKNLEYWIKLEKHRFIQKITPKF
jgi:hypothetical protein